MSAGIHKWRIDYTLTTRKGREARHCFIKAVSAQDAAFLFKINVPDGVDGRRQVVNIRYVREPDEKRLGNG